MACCLKIGIFSCCSNETLLKNGALAFCPSNSMRFSDLSSKNKKYKDKSFYFWNAKAPANLSVHAEASICVSKAMRWWEKTLKPNMVEIHSGQELIDSLSNAGHRLVILDFYSPACGGCKALHPKICQLAESNPDAIFLKVNYEELKTMCHSLHIHVLPFFRFYKGAEGRVCSFSCTNATIKKFKDALAKYGTDSSTIGPAKGLDESELMGLASVGAISRNSPILSSMSKEDKFEGMVLNSMDVSQLMGGKTGLREETNALTTS